MSKQEKYEGFTLGLALVDALPVLLFGGSGLLLGRLSGQPLVLLGAVLMFLGGLSKVLWKLVLALAKKDLPWLAKPFRYLMIGGFLLMLTAALLRLKEIPWRALGQRAVSLPSLPLFILGVLGLTAMGVLAAKLDQSRAKSNWIEQLTNTFAQLCIFLGLFFMR